MKAWRRRGAGWRAVEVGVQGPQEWSQDLHPHVGPGSAGPRGRPRGHPRRRRSVRGWAPGASPAPGRSGQTYVAVDSVSLREVLLRCLQEEPQEDHGPAERGVRKAPTLGAGGPLLPAAEAAPQGQPKPPAAAPSNLDAPTGAGPGREPEAQAAENLPLPRGRQSWSWGCSPVAPLPWGGDMGCSTEG